MAAFASEIASLQDMHTFIPYTDNVNLIPIGSLLSSKAIFNIVYNPDGTFWTRSLTITQPNYVATLIDRFSVPTSYRSFFTY